MLHKTSSSALRCLQHIRVTTCNLAPFDWAAPQVYTVGSQGRRWRRPYAGRWLRRWAWSWSLSATVALSTGPSRRAPSWWPATPRSPLATLRSALRVDCRELMNGPLYAEASSGQTNVSLLTLIVGLLLLNTRARVVDSNEWRNHSWTMDHVPLHILVAEP